MDQHPMTSLTVQHLRQAQKAPRDEFGISHHDILHNETDDKIWCVLDTADGEAVGKHHPKLGIRVDWVQQVESVRD